MLRIVSTNVLAAAADFTVTHLECLYKAECFVYIAAHWQVIHCLLAQSAIWANDEQTAAVHNQASAKAQLMRHAVSKPTTAQTEGAKLHRR